MSGRGRSALSPCARRVVYVLLLGLWLIVNVRFWAFWLAPDHRGALALWIPATLAFAYLLTGLPTFYGSMSAGCAALGRCGHRLVCAWR